MNRLLVSVLIMLGATAIVLNALAFEATSTNFELHGTSMVGIKGSGTSTNFKNIGAGGQIATGLSTSTNRKVYSGVLYWLNNVFTPVYTQIHYRWRNDNGTETTATWAASEDIALSSFAKATTTRLRFEIANKGWTRGAGPQFRLEYTSSSPCNTAIYSAVPTVSGSDWMVTNTPNITDGNATTHQITATNPFFTAGVIKDTANQTGALVISSEQYSEIEYALWANSTAPDGASYCFRLSNAGATTSFSYSVYPQVTLAGGTSLTMSIDTSTISFPSLSPGSPVIASSTIIVTTTNATGFNITVNRSDTTSTMKLGTDSNIRINDKTAWSAPANTSTAGNGATFSSTGLGFRIKKTTTDTGNYASAWWGSDDAGNALFAGFPLSGQTIVNRNTASSPGTITIANYKLDVPLNQNNGGYIGNIVYTVVANP